MTPGEGNNRKRRRFRGLLLSFPPLLLVGAVAYGYATGGRYVETENAYVKAEIITISANVDGQVTSVMAQDNRRVNAGDPLFTIDPRPFELALAAAKAEQGTVRQRIEALRAQYRQGLEEAAAAKERIRYLQSEHDRQQRLLSKGVGTQAKFDETEHAYIMARRRLSVVQETNQMVLADLGGSLELPIEQHPFYLRAEADRERAALDLAYSSVTAPVDGTLSSVALEIGEYVEAGDPLLALVTIDEPWVEANLKEVQLTYVRVGQRATIVVDSFPDVTIDAVVESISPATGAEFAILPPQNATGNWVKVVQRIPVRLKLEDSTYLELLRAGMTVSVSIDTGHERDVLSMVRGVLDQTLQ